MPRSFARWNAGVLAALSLLTLLSLLISSGPGRALTTFPPHGGSGDADVTDKCPTGQFLVGLSIRSGSWVDQMALTCAGVDPNTGATGLPKDVLPPRGGTGGGPSAKTCLPGFIIHGVALLMTAQDRQVRLFIFNCVSTTSTARHNLDLGNNAPIFPNVQQNCPAGEAVTGIRIRFGRHVNAVGLVCETFAQVDLKQPPAEPVDCRDGDEAPKEWLDMLAVHNERRADHCAPPLKWCSSLAKSAQVYADKCILNAHGSDATTGENMANAWSEMNGAPVTPALSDRDAFEQTWYCEVNNYDFNNPVFKGGFTTNCQNVNGHFTQVVWKDTAFLGCGRATCDIGGHKGTQWVCRYKPRGNVNVDDPFVLSQQVRPRGQECR
jgi:uncharacterized protein YkwD